MQLDRQAESWLNRTIPALDDIVADLRGQKPKNSHEMIVAARKYVREAMICQCDEWCARNSGKMSAILPTLYRRHHQPATERPASLDCQPSCQAMGCIFNSMEYQCRLVAFLTDDFDEVCSHACLEVYNPDTGDWELHDPLYDIHFIDKRTKKVLAAAAVAFGDFERVVPTNGRNVGWENVGQYGDAAFLRDHYYEMVAYNHASSNCLVVIDGDRASLRAEVSQEQQQEPPGVSRRGLPSPGDF